MTLLEKPYPVLEHTKAAYTHGLEAIYKVETIDLKTVRTMQVPKKEPQKQQVDFSIAESDQLEFDFGPKFRTWVLPFVLKEPIQVLQLPKQLEKWLLEEKLETIGALHSADLTTEFYLRKLGQGQREEILSRLKSYLSTQPLKKTESIDFLALLKVACGHIERKKLWVALNRFDLVGWLELSPLEQAEIRKLSDAEKEKWTKDVRLQCKGECFAEAYENIVHVFLLDWIERRGGKASKEELDEYLEMRAKNGEIARRVLEFYPLDYQLHLPHCGKEYFSSMAQSERHQKICTVTKSYFPTPAFSYDFKVLAQLVLEELAHLGISATEQEVKRAYREVLA